MFFIGQPLEPLRGHFLTAVSKESLMSSPTKLVPSLSAPSRCLFFLLFFFSVGAEQGFLETEGEVKKVTQSDSTGLWTISSPKSQYTLTKLG